MTEPDNELGLSGELLAFLSMIVIGLFVFPYVERWHSLSRREVAAFALSFLFWGSAFLGVTAAIV